MFILSTYIEFKLLKVYIQAVVDFFKPKLLIIMRGVLFNKKKTKLIAYPSGKANKTYAVPKRIGIKLKISTLFRKNATRLYEKNKLKNVINGAEIKYNVKLGFVGMLL